MTIPVPVVAATPALGMAVSTAAKARRKATAREGYRLEECTRRIIYSY